MEKWLKQFENPSAEYRPHPFWSWNDKLEENELREQIRLMAQTGHGGFYMHARDGIFLSTLVLCGACIVLLNIFVPGFSV